jgi:hypothetical protein
MAPHQNSEGRLLGASLSPAAMHWTGGDSSRGERRAAAQRTKRQEANRMGGGQALVTKAAAGGENRIRPGAPPSFPVHLPRWSTDVDCQLG